MVNATVVMEYHKQLICLPVVKPYAEIFIVKTLKHLCLTIKVKCS